MRNFLSALAATTLCSLASATDNARLDSFVETALAGVPLTSMPSPACTLYQRWSEEITFPRTAVNKELYASAAFVTPAGLGEIERQINQNLPPGQHSIWGPITGGRLGAPAIFTNAVVLSDDFNLPSYAVFLVVVPDAVDHQQAVCYSVLRSQRAM